MRKPKTNIDPFPAFEMSVNVAGDLLGELQARLDALKQKAEHEIGWHEVRVMADLNATLANALEQIDEANA